MKLGINKKASSDYSPCFGCCGFVVAVCYMLTIVVCSCCCALVDHDCVLMLMKENRKPKENNISILLKQTVGMTIKQTIH
jgi:hypothetical protein